MDAVELQVPVPDEAVVHIVQIADLGQPRPRVFGQRMEKDAVDHDGEDLELLALQIVRTVLPTQAVPRTSPVCHGCCAMLRDKLRDMLPSLPFTLSSLLFTFDEPSRSLHGENSWGGAKWALGAVSSSGH